jgi:hypothetical protein
MDPADLDLRNLTYRLFVDLARAPTAVEVAHAADVPSRAVEAGWRRLHDQHALVLEADTTAIRMANPFSAVPTAYRVFAKDRWWHAVCAWDAFGIGATLHVDSRIETSCADCGDPIRIAVRDQQPSDESLVFHCLVPARRWWDDIVFT